MLEEHFQALQAHLEGSKIMISTGIHTASIDSDNHIYNMYNGSKIITEEVLQNNVSKQITAFAVHPKLENCYLIGDKNGMVKYLRPINKMNLDKAEMIYKSQKEIKSVAFNDSGKLIAIATDGENGIIYSLNSKEMIMMKEAHEGFVTRIFFGDEYVFSIGAEGKLHLYKIKELQQGVQNEEEQQSQDLFKRKSQFQLIFMDKYKMADQSLFKRYKFLNAIFLKLHEGQNQEKIILMSGQTTLQMLNLKDEKSTYQSLLQIRQEQEILMIQQLSSKDKLTQFIVTTTQKSLSIWNFTKSHRIYTLKTLQIFGGMITQLTNIEYPEHQTFVLAIQNARSNENLYLFNHFSIFNEVMPEIQYKNGQKGSIPMQIQFESRWQESKVSKMLPQYAQFMLEKQYEEYDDAKFLFYNNIGCIIERRQNNQSIIELDLHNKGKLNKLKIQTKNRPFCHFALKEKVIAYATSTLMIFQEEKQINQGENPWEIRWQNIQGVTIGGNWVAASNSEEIRIFDYKGHDLHCICFDRPFVTFQAYEDILVIVYHGGLPLWGCQALKMRVYKITENSVTLQKDVVLPIKPNSHLKWFGFSQEGQIYCQDTLQVLRSYDFDRNQWHIVYSLQDKPERFYIQHIQGQQIYGFRLQQKQGEKVQPRVLPRSHPRKHNLEIRYENVSFLNTNQNAYLKKIMLKNIIINHEEFRYLRWYKYKYSRTKNHSWFNYSKSIKSQSQIKTIRMEIDFQLIDYLKKFIQRSKEEQTIQFQNIARSLLVIIQKWANFEETKEKAKKLLITNHNILLTHQFESMAFPTYQTESKTCTKLNEINYLQKMLAIIQNCL